MSFRFITLFLFGAAHINLSSLQAQPNSSLFWDSVSDETLNAAASQVTPQRVSQTTVVKPVRAVLPQKYRTLRLKKEVMEGVLRRAPPEFTTTMEEANVQIDLPLPEGGFAKFLVMESSILPPNLAKKYPSIRTYVVQGVDDPTATGRIQVTPRGFQGLIVSDQGKGSFAIAPYWQNNPTGNLCYYLKESGLKIGTCSTPAPPARQAKLIQSASLIATPSAISSNLGASWAGGSVRLVRLAVACSGEFAQQISGTSGSVPGNLPITLEFIVQVVNAVSAILDRDFGLRFQLVEAQENIIFLNPTSDPYPALINHNGNTAALAVANQSTIDSTIGSDNYEFGHLFVGDTVSWGESTGSIYGSVFGILGDNTRKAMCISARGSADFSRYNFDLLVAHEMGHGLNANHTFSDYKYEGTGAQVEPGSGSTIMSYAGITPTGNLQGDRDGYYSTKSLEQMITYGSSSPGNAAFQIIANGNSAPALLPLRDYTIPAQTPFVLTATASDANGDTLTYCWEQMDSALRAKNPVVSPRDDGSSPLFRSFPAATNPNRIFPQLKYVLNNKNVPPPGDGSSGSTNYATGEFLPTTTRNMKFRVTVRDNSASGGGLAFASCNVKSIGGAGPFAVTNFNTNAVLISGSQQTLGWSVNFTGPGTLINCANVRISLSLDGGTNFSHVIAGSAPNNGKYTFVVPDVATGEARFKVEAIGNIFFDISDANLTIRPSTVSNDLFARPRVIGPSLPISATGSTPGATSEGSEPAHATGPASASV